MAPKEEILVVDLAGCMTWVLCRWYVPRYERRLLPASMQASVHCCGSRPLVPATYYYVRGRHCTLTIHDANAVRSLSVLSIAIAIASGARAGRRCVCVCVCVYGRKNTAREGGSRSDWAWRWGLVADHSQVPKWGSSHLSTGHNACFPIRDGCLHGVTIAPAAGRPLVYSAGRGEAGCIHRPDPDTHLAGESDDCRHGTTHASFPRHSTYSSEVVRGEAETTPATHWQLVTVSSTPPYAMRTVRDISEMPCKVRRGFEGICLLGCSSCYAVVFPSMVWSRRELSCITGQLGDERLPAVPHFC